MAQITKFNPITFGDPSLHHSKPTVVAIISIDEPDFEIHKFQTFFYVIMNSNNVNIQTHFNAI